MKKKLIMMALALWSLVSVQAYGFQFEVDGINYTTISDTSVAVVRNYGKKYTGSVVIPATITRKSKTYSVTRIGNYAFYECTGLTSVSIPDGVTTIESSAFDHCSGLTSVTIPNRVTYIGSRAFSGCSGLTSVAIPNSVTYIGGNAFNDCSSLTSVTIPNSVTTIGEYAFNNCSSLTSVTIPNGVTTIGNSTFYNCSGLTSVTIPNGVTTIGGWAFARCNSLTLVTIPEGVTNIGSCAFYNCSGLTSITIPESLTYIGTEVFSGCSNLTSVGWNAIACYSNSHPYSYAFYNCSNVNAVTFGNKVTRIPAYLCYGMGLSSVTLPDGLKRIEAYAFRNCNLTSVTIPDGVDSIGEYAFANCGLTSVTLPESVAYIGDYAFGGANLSSPLYNSKVFIFMPRNYEGRYTIPSGIQMVAGGAFENCYNLTSVTIPESVTFVGNKAFNGTGISSPLYNGKVFAYMPRNYEGSYTIPSGIQSIAGNAFYNCNYLTSVTIPSSVSTIGEEAFRDCYSLTSVTIPENVTAIGKEAFAYCYYLRSVAWNAVNCRVDGSSTFSNGYDVESNITTFTFGDKVSYIPSYLCYGMNGLTSVTIPEGVDSIGYSAFGYCKGLKSVTWNAVNCWSPYENNADNYYNSSASPFHDGYDASPHITTFVFGDKVAHIPASLCQNLDGLTSVTLPASVTSIGHCAFYDCDGLTSVMVPEGVTTIGRQAFATCDNLKSVTWNAVNCRNLYQDENNYYWSYEYYSPFRQEYGRKIITTFTFGNKVTHIPAYLCSGMWALTSVTLPASVTAIGKQAFDGCDNLAMVTSLAENPPVCDADGVFDRHKTLYVPRGRKETYEAAPIWRYFYKIIELGNGGVVTLLVNDESMGNVHGDGDYELGEQARLMAAPRWGYHFVKWDDGNTENPRWLTVTGDITLTAVFAKGNDVDNDKPVVANEEALAAAPFAYVQGRTVYLSDDLGEVEAFTATGNRVYRGFDRTIALPQPGVYILRVVADGRRSKIIVK